MKKILIAVSQLRVGGVSKALVELLKHINDKYEITLLCFDHDGEFFKDIPANIKIVQDNPYLVLTERSAFSMQQYGYKYKLIRQLCSAWTKLFNKEVPAKYICSKFGRIKENYDIAIAFGHPQKENIFCNLAGEVVLNCVNARKKAIVIHCDYEKYGGHCECNDNLIMQFDKIATVSRSVGDAVLRCIPQGESKICMLRNFHDFNSICNMSNYKTVKYMHEYVLVTVARLSEEKGILAGIDIITRLKNKGYDVEWHIVGDGPLRKKIENRILETKSEGYIILEGVQSNPYRYIKNADFLFVPSIHEAAPMVFDEAACLKVPIITTDTLSAKELVDERNIGIVCKNYQISDALEYAFANKVIYKNNLNEYVSTNLEANNDFESLCNN